MNSKIIRAQEITIDTICESLDAAVVDFLHHDENSVYVTGHDFPTFWKFDAERQFLFFWTYLDAVDDADEVELLEFANACNCRLILVQFSYRSRASGDPRLFGYHALSLKDGLNPKQVIRTGRMFASIFSDAASEGLEKGFLRPLGQCGAYIDAGAKSQSQTRH